MRCSWKAQPMGASIKICYVMLCYVMLCYVMLCYVMLCYVMLCYVMLCYVMLCSSAQIDMSQVSTGNGWGYRIWAQYLQASMYYFIYYINCKTQAIDAKRLPIANAGVVKVTQEEHRLADKFLHVSIDAISLMAKTLGKCCTLCKGPCKGTQHCWTTTCNIVGLRCCVYSMEPQQCWHLLRIVWNRSNF